MYIESVQLKNFRNYDSLELDLAQGTNIFYGNNAQGKTNILEALYLCGTTKSHKGSRDKDMIQFGKDESHIRMMVKRGTEPANHIQSIAVSESATGFSCQEYLLNIPIHLTPLLCPLQAFLLRMLFLFQPYA